MIGPGWVRPADSFRSEVIPAQNSRASALGKRSKGPISAAMMQPQISSMPGTLLSNSTVLRNRLGAIGEGDLQMQPGTLAFHELEDFEEVGEGLLLDGLEQMAEGQDPFLGGGPVEFRPGDVGGQEHGTHGVFGAAEEPAELVPVPAELAKLHQFVVGDVSQRTFAASESLGDVAGVVGIVVPSFAASVGQFGGVGDVDAIDAAAVVVDEPLDEADGFDGHVRGPWSSEQPGGDSVAALGGDFHAVDERAIGLDGRQGDGVLVQINADERLVSYDCFGHSECLRVRGRKNVHTQRKFSFRRPLHGFTLGGAFGGHYDHRHLDRAVAAGGAGGARGGAAMQCSNNLKQLSLGVLVHEQARGIFPDGGETSWAAVDQRSDNTNVADRGPGEVPTVAPKQNWSWIYQILPCIEQESLWQTRSVTGIMKTPLSVVCCPSRFGPRVHNWSQYAWVGYRAMSDYAGNAGVNTTGSNGWGTMGNGLDAPITRRPDGTGVRGSSVRMADILDGTSNTLLAGEKCLNIGLINQHQTDDDSGWVDGWDWDNIRWGYFQPQPDWDDGNPADSDSGNAALHAAFGSSHNGFFNAAMCDGSVRPISFNISLDTFTLLSSRNDGKLIDGNAF